MVLKQLILTVCLLLTISCVNVNNAGSSHKSQARPIIKVYVLVNGRDMDSKKNIFLLLEEIDALRLFGRETLNIKGSLALNKAEFKQTKLIDYFLNIGLGNDYLNSIIIEEIATPGDFGCENIGEFLRDNFIFIDETKKWTNAAPTKLNLYDSRIIAMLINSGYNTYKGDILGNLIVEYRE